MGKTGSFLSGVSAIFSASLLVLLAVGTVAQDYEVADIDCNFGAPDGTGERISARLRKPEGFRGYPTFADDRRVDPQIDGVCQIRPDPSDPSGLIYNLLITDFTRCGVLKRNGFVNVRIWFPQLPGIVMMSDQEVIIMCKPPQSTVVQNMAAGFAGSIPNQGRISGIVEESPGKLEYLVALYRESPQTGDFSLTVDEAVPIGTKLQLRATINTLSAWKYAKLVDVTVSNSPEDPQAPGHIVLVQNGCRNQEYSSIMPGQPFRRKDKLHEVLVEFEAFLLDYMKPNDQLWVHSTLKACTEAVDCLPEFCLDLFQPSGHGRRKRSLLGKENESRNDTEDPWSWLDIDSSILQRHIPKDAWTPEFEEQLMSARKLLMNKTTEKDTKGPSKDIGQNIGVRVILPGDEYYHSTSIMPLTCETYLIVAAIMGAMLLLSALIMCYLATRLSRLRTKREVASLEKSLHYHSRHTYGEGSCPG